MFIAIIFDVFIISVIAWLLINNMRAENVTAVIYKNGELIDEIRLSSVTEDYEFTVDGTNTILVRHSEIGVIKADCPDQICVKTGFIESGIIPIICLPNRLEIRIKGGENELDAVVR